MEVSIIFKIGAVGILVSVLSEVLKHSRAGRTGLASPVGGDLIVVLFWILPYIYDLFAATKNCFLCKEAAIGRSENCGFGTDGGGGGAVFLPGEAGVYRVHKPGNEILILICGAGKLEATSVMIRQIESYLPVKAAY